MANTGKTGSKEHSDKYYAEQWDELQKQQKEKDERFRSIWLAWQKEVQGRARYSTWLVIPAALIDYGTRPLTTGMIYWASPFIGVTSPDPSGMPQAGAPNSVYARVFNLGAATSAPTSVSFYWADPSVGLGAADAHLIGQTMVEVPSKSSAVVTCPIPWVPAYYNNGHECLFVTADNPIFDPVQAPFQPWADRHVGQRNVHVLPATAQSMQLWLPGDTFPLFAELRVLALRVKTANLVLKRTAVDTINQVADHVLNGFQQHNRTFKTASHLKFSIQRIDAERVVSAYRIQDETRPVVASDEIRGAKAQEAHIWGDALLRVQTKPGLNQLLRLDFKPMDLAGDEFVILHFTWLAAGQLRGGYALTFANPGWFKPGPVQPPVTGGSMSKPEERRDLCDLVIRHNPQARAVLEIAEQLVHHLPIESAKQLSKGIKILGHHVPGELLEQFSAGLFPIKNTEELVEKATAMIRIFMQHGAAYRPTLSAPVAKLLDHLEGSGDRPNIPILVASGKPIFTVSPEEKED